MSVSSRFASRSLVLGLTALVAPLGLAAPAAAASYDARPATLPAEARLVVRSVAWARDGDRLRGASEESRPAVICQGLVKRVGPLVGFAVDGRAFAAAELDRCNAAAGAPAALAAAR